MECINGKVKARVSQRIKYIFKKREGDIVEYFEMEGTTK